VSIEEVRSLVAERQRYDDWLAALDARRAETPERVFERVRGDYAARRGEVLTRLAEHVAELEMLSGTLQQQRGELSTQLDALEDQRVEAMIRNAVGEYDNDKWEALRQDVEGQITKLTDDRALVQMELDEIHALLEHARPQAVAAPEPEPAPGGKHTVPR
jgi:chromosome segregation ATPase